MANQIEMAKVHSILTLHRRGWSNRRIARELGVHRKTVSRYVRALKSGQAKVTTNPPPGSAPSSGPPSACEPFRELILEKLEQGLSAQRIWQDLRLEHGFANAYDSVKRFVRRLGRATPFPFRRIECPPGGDHRQQPAASRMLGLPHRIEPLPRATAKRSSARAPTASCRRWRMPSGPSAECHGRS